MRDACVRICGFFCFGGNSPHMSFLTGQVRICERNPHVVSLENHLVGLSLRHRIFLAATLSTCCCHNCCLWTSLHFWDKWACGQISPKNREKIHRSTSTHPEFQAIWDSLLGGAIIVIALLVGPLSSNCCMQKHFILFKMCVFARSKLATAS